MNKLALISLFCVIVLVTGVYGIGYPVRGKVNDAIDCADGGARRVIHVYVTGDPDNYDTCYTTSYLDNNNYECDTENIPGHTVEIGSSITVEVIDKGDGYYSEPISVLVDTVTNVPDLQLIKEGIIEHPDYPTCQGDTDGDYINQVSDNCPSVFNWEQYNADNDGSGDACDCDSSDDTVYHNAPEICDGQDNQCDGDIGFGEVDEGCDDDSDDYCDQAMTTVGTPAVCPNGGDDCDDTNSAVNPGASESCNGLDDNCDDVIDEGGDALCNPGETCTGEDGCIASSFTLSWEVVFESTLLTYTDSFNAGVGTGASDGYGSEDILQPPPSPSGIEMKTIVDLVALTKDYRLDDSATKIWEIKLKAQDQTGVGFTGKNTISWFLADIPDDVRLLMIDYGTDSAKTNVVNTIDLKVDPDNKYRFEVSGADGTYRYLELIARQVSPSDNIAYYPFDSDFLDASGNFHDGISHGDIQFIPGVINDAALFDGDGDYLDIGLFVPTDSFSVSAWVKKAATANEDQAIFGYGTDDYFGYMGLMNIDHSGYKMPWGSMYTTESLDDQWTFVTWVRESTDNHFRVYVDGEIFAHIYGTWTGLLLPPANNTQSIGVSLNHASPMADTYFSGYLDELRFYDRVLTEQEIVNMCNADQAASGIIPADQCYNMMPLSSGWNLVSMPIVPTEFNKDREISLKQGWNLFGHVSKAPFYWLDAKIRKAGETKTIEEAHSDVWVQSTIYHFDPGQQVYTFVPGDTDYLEPSKGYWLYAFEDDLTLILENAGGAAMENDFLWTDAEISDGTETKTLEEANQAGWLQSTVYYYDAEEQVYKFVPGDDDYTYPWKGYWIYCNIDDLTLTIS